MSSSGSSSFFTFVVVLAAAAAGSVYAIKHRTEVLKFAATFDKSSVRSGDSAKGAGQGTLEVSKAGTGLEAGDVELKANPSGHFEAEVEVNGSAIDVMVDTGATLVAMTYEDAERAGIFLKSSDFTHQVKTANGIAKVAPIEIGSITIGDITVRNIRGAVTEPGKLHRTLLGMSFLSRLSRVEMRSNALVLHE